MVMALGISRTHLGGVLRHQGLISRAASPYIFTKCPSFATNHSSTRSYSEASSILTKKGPVSAKARRKAAHAKSSPPSPTAAKTQPEKSTSREMEETQQLSSPSKDLKKEITKKAKVATNTADSDLSEDQMKQVERMMAFQHLMPTVDPWGQDIKDTLDVMIPVPFFLTKPKYGDLKENFFNEVRNAASLSQLAVYDSIPGFHISTRKLRDKFKLLLKIFSTNSVKAGTLLDPFRQMALDNYKELNQVIASRDEKAIKKLTTRGYQNEKIDLVKSSKYSNPNGRLIWRLHRLVSPVQVVSLRTVEGYLAPDNPKIGNRLLIHALVKFETEQSLEIYNDQGVALHKPLNSPEQEATNKVIQETQPKKSWRVPAMPKQVTEYLVLEKKMWVSGLWQFREQVWPINRS